VAVQAQGLSVPASGFQVRHLIVPRRYGDGMEFTTLGRTGLTVSRLCLGTMRAARSRHFLGLVSEQCIYNLMTRHAELEVIPAAQHNGIGIIAWSPLHGGLLSGAIRKLKEGTAGRVADERGLSQEGLTRHRETVEAYEKLCQSVEVDPADMAVAWLLNRPGVTAPIIGPRTVEQLDGSLRAFDVTFNDDILSKLDELFPPVGNGGAGPEAWAW
jgi:NDP-hexose C3-ketoreductase / dTDP-4-oxo-2-deoxy-alpha-D-pentos-2-ene 2,3-reductase